MKRRTAECLQRNKKIGATIQDEDEEYMMGHGTEIDEENDHEREQEKLNSDDGNALESEQEKQSSAVSAWTNNVRVDA